MRMCNLHMRMYDKPTTIKMVFVITDLVKKELEVKDSIVLHLVKGADCERRDDAHHYYRWNQKK